MYGVNLNYLPRSQVVGFLNTCRKDFQNECDIAKEELDKLYRSGLEAINISNSEKNHKKFFTEKSNSVNELSMRPSTKRSVDFHKINSANIINDFKESHKIKAYSNESIISKNKINANVDGLPVNDSLKKMDTYGSLFTKYRAEVETFCSKIRILIANHEKPCNLKDPVEINRRARRLSSTKVKLASDLYQFRQKVESLDKIAHDKYPRKCPSDEFLNKILTCFKIGVRILKMYIDHVPDCDNTNSISCSFKEAVHNLNKLCHITFRLGLSGLCDSESSVLKKSKGQTGHPNRIGRSNSLIESTNTKQTGYKKPIEHGLIKVTKSSSSAGRKGSKNNERQRMQMYFGLPLPPQFTKGSKQSKTKTKPAITQSIIMNTSEVTKDPAHNNMYINDSQLKTVNEDETSLRQGGDPPSKTEMKFLASLTQIPPSSCEFCPHRMDRIFSTVHSCLQRLDKIIADEKIIEEQFKQQLNGSHDLSLSGGGCESSEFCEIHERNVSPVASQPLQESNSQPSSCVKFPSEDKNSVLEENPEIYKTYIEMDLSCLKPTVPEELNDFYDSCDTMDLIQNESLQNWISKLNDDIQKQDKIIESTLFKD